MNKTSFNIIIPVYNVEEFLDKCLESLHNQTYDNWQAIVVDDGSTDKSYEICKKWALEDSRFNVYHKENSGVCDTRNFALEKVNCDYIAFVDADDFLSEDALLNVSKAVDKYNPDIVFTGHSRVYEDNTIKETRNGDNLIFKDTEEIVKQTLLIGEKSYLGVLWNKFVKSSCIYEKGNVIGFDSRYAIGEDQIWLLNVSKNIKKGVSLSDALYYYRIRNNSVVHSNIWNEKKMSEVYAREKMVELTEKFYPSLSRYAHVKYRNCLNAVGLSLFKGRQFKELKGVSRYCRRYVSDYIKSPSVSMINKLKAVLLQIVCFIFS